MKIIVVIAESFLSSNREDANYLCKEFLGNSIRKENLILNEIFEILSTENTYLDKNNGLDILKEFLMDQYNKTKDPLFVKIIFIYAF